MPSSRATPLLNNFTAGEISPKIDARSDLARYANGCLKLENMMPYVAGAASRRPGSYYVTTTKYPDKKSRLISFEFSTVQGYNIEFAEKCLRFCKDGGQIVVAYAAWQGSSNGYVLGDLVIESGNYYRCLVAHNSGTFATDLSADKWIVTAGAADLAYEIPTPYMEADLFQIKTCQSADVMFIDHPAYPPKELTRTGHTAWTLTAHAAGKFSGAGDYPSANCFFEQRLFHFASDNNPQTLWGSKSGDFGDYSVSTPAADDDGIEYQLGSGKVDRIRWAVGTDCLVIGTVGGIWKFSGTTTQEALTPTNVSAKSQAPDGAKDLEAERVGNSVMYVQRGGRKIRSVSYSFQIDGLMADDITAAAEHITKGTSVATSGIVDMDYQQNPYPVLWGVRADGQLVGMLWEPGQKVSAFFRYVTDGKIESASVLSNESTEDEMWIATRRLIGSGNTEARFIEYFKPYEFWGQIENYFGVDCGLTYDGTPATTISGLNHLIGETVAVLADGATHPNCVVSPTGTITLNAAASVVHAGLPFTNILKPMKIEGQSSFGTTRAKKKRISSMTVSFQDTYSAKWGPDENNLITIPFGIGTTPALFSGDIAYPFNADVDTEATLCIVGDQPLPMTVLCIIPDMVTYEG